MATDDRLPLPPENGSPARILSLPGTSVQQYHADTISALVDDTDPDAIVAAPPAESSVAPALQRQIDKPIFQVGHGMRPDAIIVGGDDILIVATPSGTRSLSTDTVNDRLPNHKTSENDPHAGTAGHRCIITDALSLSVNPYERSATVEGFDEYSDRLPTEWLNDTLTHLSTALRAGFKSTVDSQSGGHPATVIGIGDSDAELGVGRDNTDTNAALIEVYRNGAVSTGTLDPERFGLRSITQVGQQRANTLRQAGLNTTSFRPITGLTSAVRQLDQNDQR